MNAIQTEGGAADTLSIMGTVTGDIMTNTGADTLSIMGTVSGSNIRTDAGGDTVSLAAGSTTTGVAIDLGAGDDTLNLASTAFGALDGGADADTLSVSGTGITLDGSAHSNFETLTFAAGSNTLSGTHVGLASSTIATGATLDLASGSSLTGDLANSGMLTLAGAGIGSATITGSLTLNAGGTVSLNTLTDGSFDQIVVGGAVSVDGTLALGQQATMPEGTVVLIDGGAALSGSFASTTGLISGLLIGQAIAYDSPSGEVRLVTSLLTPEPDPEFPTGCVVTPTTPLADGGTLTCISAAPITEALATTVDGVTIIIGDSGTPTTVMTASGDAITASIASTSAAGDISINSEFGTLSGGANGIVATTAGSGSITITGGGSVTGNTNRGIDARLSNSGATGDLSITASGAVSGGSDGIYALNAGTGTTSITVASVSASAGSAIRTRTTAGANITVNAGGTVSGGGGMNAIQTEAPSGDSSSTPADRSPSGAP